MLGKRYYVLQLYFAIRQSKRGEQSENNRYTLIITSFTLKESKDRKLLLKLPLSSVSNSERSCELSGFIIFVVYETTAQV